MSNQKTLCIYHKNCADGFGAAWVVRKALGENAVEFYAASYQEEPPAVEGRDVVIVDFSYKRSVMEQIAQSASSVLVLDHHESAEAELAPLLASGVIQGKFDMNHSGAMLTWFHYFDVTPPNLIYFIEDRDLWKFENDYTGAYMAAVFSYPQQFDVWDELARRPVKAMIDEGSAILRTQAQHVYQLQSQAFRTNIAGYDVPVANAPYFYASNLGHVLAIDEPFSATYSDSEGKRKYSLRSANGTGLNVADIAQRFGGGGHKHAAGFVISNEDLHHLSNPNGLQAQ